MNKIEDLLDSWQEANTKSHDKVREINRMCLNEKYKAVDWRTDFFNIVAYDLPDLIKSNTRLIAALRKAIDFIEDEKDKTKDLGSLHYFNANLVAILEELEGKNV